MTVSTVAPDGWVRTYAVRAPPDWYVAASEEPIPLLLFLPNNGAVDGFATTVGIDKFIRGAFFDSWPTLWPPGDPTSSLHPNFGNSPHEPGGGNPPVGPPAVGAGDPLRFPKFIAVFVNPMSPRNEVAPGLGPGECFNSGSVGPESASLWDWHDVRALEHIVLQVEEQYNQILRRMTQNPDVVAIDPERRFALGLGDGGTMCWRLLQESTLGGNLHSSVPFRGIYAHSATSGGQVLNDPLSPSGTGGLFQRFVADGVNFSADPLRANLANPKVILQTMAVQAGTGGDGVHFLGSAGDSTDLAAATPDMVPFDELQFLGQTDFVWAFPADGDVGDLVEVGYNGRDTLNHKAYTAKGSAAWALT
jgi:hypothetical protein